jgi:hypothetical protein
MLLAMHWAFLQCIAGSVQDSELVRGFLLQTAILKLLALLKDFNAQVSVLVGQRQAKAAQGWFSKSSRTKSDKFDKTCSSGSWLPGEYASSDSLNAQALLAIKGQIGVLLA